MSPRVSLNASQVKSAAARLKALADPVRLRIVLSLQGGNRYVNDIVKSVRAAQPTVSKHLAQLRAAGIVTSDRDGTRVRYALAAGWAPGVIGAAGKAAGAKAPTAKKARKAPAAKTRRVARKSARRR